MNTHVTKPNATHRLCGSPAEVSDATWKDAKRWLDFYWLAAKVTCPKCVEAVRVLVAHERANPKPGRWRLDDTGLHQIADANREMGIDPLAGDDVGAK